jgi:hypothetical protein
MEPPFDHRGRQRGRVDGRGTLLRWYDIADDLPVLEATSKSETAVKKWSTQRRSIGARSRKLKGRE